MIACRLTHMTYLKDVSYKMVTSQRQQILKCNNILLPFLPSPPCFSSDVLDLHPASCVVQYAKHSKATKSVDINPTPPFQSA